MQDVNVLVVFLSRGESMERLALAAAVGAVQGRGNIRLRCLRDADVDTEFVAPRPSDAEWADAILAGMPVEPGDAPDALPRFFDLFGQLSGKIGASFTDGSETASLQAAMQRAGLTTIEMLSEPDPLTAARLQGRRVADAARTLRHR
jgi:hypothetical protein